MRLRYQKCALCFLLGFVFVLPSILSRLLLDLGLLGLHQGA
jgi:hypothetical protein